MKYIASKYVELSLKRYQRIKVPITIPVDSMFKTSPRDTPCIVDRSITFMFRVRPTPEINIKYMVIVATLA